MQPAIPKLALVTGGCGFLGRELTVQLIEQGWSVRVLDCSVPDAAVAGVDYVQGSVTEADSVAAALEGVTDVFHTAGIPDLWRRDPRELDRVNGEGTATVCEAARKAGVHRLVCTSTVLLEDVLGSTSSPFGGDRPSQLQRRLDELPGPYTRSKLRAEAAVRGAVRMGLNAVVVRLAGLIGPGARLTPPGRMVQGFLQRKYPAYLDAELNLLDVRDAAAAHLVAAESLAAGAAVSVDGTRIPLRELLTLLEQLSGERMPRLRIPGWLATCCAAIDEWLADRGFKAEPAGPLEGVRLARLCGRRERSADQPIVPIRALRETLLDTLESWPALAAGEGRRARTAAAPQAIEHSLAR